MAMQRLHLEKEFVDQKIDGLHNWHGTFDGKKLALIHETKGIRHSIDYSPCKIGDYVGIIFDGEDPKVFSIKPPKDERIRLMWELGFTSKKRIIPKNPNGFDIKGYLSSLHSWKPPESGWTSDDISIHDVDTVYTVRQNGGRVMVQAVRRGSSHGKSKEEEWFMHPNATIDHVKEFVTMYKVQNS